MNLKIENVMLKYFPQNYKILSIEDTPLKKMIYLEFNFDKNNFTTVKTSFYDTV